MTEIDTPFLRHQAAIMKQRESFRTEAKSIVVGSDETKPFDPSAPATVESYDISGKLVSSREIPARKPAPQRIQKPAPLTLKDIKESLIETGNEIDAASGKFQSDTQSLDAFYSEQKTLREEIANLRAQLREKQDRLHQLGTAGTPRDIYAGSIVDLERQVMSLAGALLATLREQAAQRIYGISFEELTPDGQRDAQARYRKVLSRFQSNFYMQLGRTHAQATGEQIDKRASQLLDDIDSLLTTKDFFPQE
jgi:hypothetical protein